MDNRTKRSLDQYITGGRYHETIETITCKQCGYNFPWAIAHEYGTTWYQPEEVTCPKCGILCTEIDCD
jgi:hypothetical protein